MEKSGKESGKGQFVLKKAYEISYAVFRIASRIGNAAFKEHLEKQALSLLDAATVENYAWIGIVSRAIEYLIRFGGDIGLVHETNKETILFQLNSLEVGIAGPEKSATADAVPLDDIFSGQEPLFTSIPKYAPVNLVAGFPIADPVNNPAMNPAMDAAINPAKKSGNESGNTIQPGIRQSAILQKLRQSGNCRIRDLQEVLPDCSERTLRYDLQALTEKNLIERVGSGGPAVFYRLGRAAERLSTEGNF